jgi:hypothetical protein
MPSFEKEKLAEFPPSQSQNLLNINIPSPVNEELEGQLSTWLAGVPSFLRWSPNPGLGEQAKIGTRLKLLYWFARFSLYGGSTTHAIHNHSGACFTMQAWNAVQDTLFAAQNMVQAFVSEESDPDPILQRRWVASSIFNPEHDSRLTSLQYSISCRHSRVCNEKGACPEEIYAGSWAAARNSKDSIL